MSTRLVTDPKHLADLHQAEVEQLFVQGHDLIWQALEPELRVAGYDHLPLITTVTGNRRLRSTLASIAGLGVTRYNHRLPLPMTKWDELSRGGLKLQYSVYPFNGMSSSLLVRICAHEYLHLAICMLTDDDSYDDGNPVFESYLTQLKLPSNIRNDAKEDAESKLVGNLITRYHSYKQLNKRPVKPRTTAHYKVGVFCCYCGEPVRTFKKVSPDTLINLLGTGHAHKCHSYEDTWLCPQDYWLIVHPEGEHLIADTVADNQRRIYGSGQPKEHLAVAVGMNDKVGVITADYYCKYVSEVWMTEPDAPVLIPWTDTGNTPLYLTMTIE